jgi:mono/diheme cytochrome c family protein
MSNHSRTVVAACARATISLGLAAGLLAACGGQDEFIPIDGPPPVDAAPGVDAEPPPMATAERGDYLVNSVLLCGDCHTPRLKGGAPDLANFLAGVECFIDVNGPGAAGGCLNSRNLTDHPTGLANRSDAEIKAMFLDGVRPNGEALNAIMPYWIFHNLTDVDADSIVLYLRTVAGVDNTVPASDPTIFPPPAAPAAPFALADTPAPSTDDPELAHGRYLATLACLECHTPRTDMLDNRSLDETRLFAGGNGFPRELFGLGDPFPAVIFTTNLTPDATGLQGWTQAEVVGVLRDGVDRDGALVCPPMPGGMAGYGSMADDDRNAIAAYLLDLGAIANTLPNGCAIPAP